MSMTSYSVIVAALLLPSSLAAAVTVDDARATEAGIRKLSGKRLTLYTDLAGDEIDQLPAVFDQAFPQWCRYFHVKEDDHPDWHMTGFLMKDKARFVRAGLLPDDLPPFEHGYSRGDTLWLYEQPSEYYRRHLLLHEGTHGFMNTVLGSCGPPWYMEGMAEYLGTHRWHDGRLTLGYMPKKREEVPEWGRVRIIQDAVAAGRPLDLKTVLEFPPTAHHETGPYAWCWAAVSLLDRHPRYRDRFREVFRFVQQPDFNTRFYELFKADWPALCEEWQVMVANLEYGYDVARSAIDFRPAKPQAGEGQGVRETDRATDSPSSSTAPATVTVAADRGWQNTGLRLEAGVTYRLTATGRYQVAKTPKIWWCEPGGVSIRYYQGRPLGMLLAAIRPDEPRPDGSSALLYPTAVGLGATLKPAASGTLFLKINDSPGELADNEGELKVEVEKK
jgi:hypothetical protein